MDKRTEEMLIKDSIAETEQIFGGKHYSEFNDVENGFMILKFMQDNEDKKQHFQSIKDTYWGIPWDEFKNLLKRKGFKEGLKYDITHDNSIDEVIIYYHSEKGLIIYAESYYNKESVNGGRLYGEIKANDEDGSKVIWRWLSTGGCIDVENKIYETQHDVREGLFSKLDCLESAGQFLPKWTKKDRFLWFVDYTESKVEGYDYKTITAEKIKRCPKELQDIIGC